MVLKIIYLICVILVSIAAGTFTSFAISKLGEINTKKDSIPKCHWSKGWIIKLKEIKDMPADFTEFYNKWAFPWTNKNTID